MILYYLDLYLTGWACMACLHAALTGFNPEATSHRRFLTETLLWPYYLPLAIFAFMLGFIKGLRNGFRNKTGKK